MESEGHLQTTAFQSNQFWTSKVDMESNDIEPPAYKPMIIAEEAEVTPTKEKKHRVVCPLLLAISYVFGMHLFKSPYECNENFCRRRTYAKSHTFFLLVGCLYSFWERISIPNLVISAFNLVVSVNHFRLAIVPHIQRLRCNECGGLRSLQSAEFAQELVQ